MLFHLTRFDEGFLGGVNPSRSLTASLPPEKVTVSPNRKGGKSSSSKSHHGFQGRAMFNLGG